jgi:hypothetical protein
MLQLGCVAQWIGMREGWKGQGKRALVTCPVTAASSDGRRNTGLQFTRGSFEA